MMKKMCIAQLVLFACILSASTMHAQDRATVINAARDLMKKHDHAIVKVRAVSQTSSEGFGMVFGNKDQVTQATAMFIDDTGLAILPYSAIKANANVQIRVMNVGGEEQVIKPKEEFKSFDFILADNSRVPAKIVITDPELDLAVVAPEKPLDDAAKKKIGIISIDGNPGIELLDFMVVLDRLSTMLNSQASVSLTRVGALISKPRTMYVAGVSAGAICFSDKGEFVGLGVVVRPDGTSISEAMQAEAVVLPAKYIREVVVQAKEKLAKD